jgi:hypothetical protein
MTERSSARVPDSINRLMDGMTPSSMRESRIEKVAPSKPMRMQRLFTPSAPCALTARAVQMGASEIDQLP